MKLFLRKRVPLSIQTAPICLSSAPSLGKKKVNTIFKHYHIFLDRVIGLTAWCSISLSAMAHSEPHWMMILSSTERHSVPICLPPSYEKNGCSQHMCLCITTDHRQRSVWAKTAPSSHPVRVQQSLPLDAEGIGGPVIDHPCSSSGARPSSKPLLPKAAIHKWQQRPGLGAHISALLARNWRWSGLCLPTDSH